MYPIWALVLICFCLQYNLQLQSESCFAFLLLSLDAILLSLLDKKIIQVLYFLVIRIVFLYSFKSKHSTDQILIRSSYKKITFQHPSKLWSCKMLYRSQCLIIFAVIKSFLRKQDNCANITFHFYLSDKCNCSIKL